MRYDKQGILLSVREKRDVVERELQLCGYFCIVTSEKMTAAEALIQYKGRDISEKLFQADKTFLGSNSMRIHSFEALSAKLFIEFIALIVRNRIYHLLKETMLRMESRQTYFTVPKAIRELEKIEMVRRNNGSYRLDHAITKKQKIILSAFGMSDEEMRKKALEIAELLKNSQSLLQESMDELDELEVNGDGTDAIDLFD